MPTYTEVYVPLHRSTSTVPDRRPALSEHEAQPGTPGNLAGARLATPTPPTPPDPAPVVFAPDNVFTRAKAAGGFPGQLPAGKHRRGPGSVTVHQLTNRVNSAGAA